MGRYTLLFLIITGLLARCQQKKADTATFTATADSILNTENAAPADSVPTVGNPVLLTSLPDKYNTPDGLALAPDGTVYLSVPNLADNTYPVVLLKIVGIAQLTTSKLLSRARGRC